MTINDLPKTIDCPNNCDGVMALNPEYTETFLNGKLNMSFTTYAYECPKCGVEHGKNRNKKPAYLE